MKELIAEDSTLLESIKSRQWSLAIERCKTATSKEYLFQDPSSFHQTSLHLAVKLHAPFRVIQVLVTHEAFHEAMMMPDKYCNYLPLHLAAAASVVVGNTRTSSSNRGVRTPPRNKSASSEQLPETAEARGNVRQSTTTIFMLIHKCPNISFLLKQKDKRGMTPLHVACRFGAPFDIIKALVDYNPTILNVTTRNGKTPLVLAYEYHQQHSLETISFLLNHPGYDIYNDEYNGWTPLHIACFHGASHDKVSLLIKAHPGACFKTTITSRQTPLELGFNPDAAYFSEWERNNTVQLLLNPDFFGTYSHESISKNDKMEEGGLFNDIGMIHHILSFQKIFPGLLDYALERFPSDVSKV